MLRIVLILFSLFYLSLPAKAEPLSTQRELYKQAQLDLQAGKRDEFLKLSNELRTYPLYPYLIFADLTQRINKAPDQEIDSFLEQYADTPLASRLRLIWLQNLADQKRWPLILKYYQTTEDANGQCLRIQALLNEGNTNLAFTDIKKLWLVGHKQPPACETVFSEWFKTGQLTPELIWERVRLAIKSGNNALLNTLIAWSPKPQQEKIKLWQKVVSHPELVADFNLFQPLTNVDIREIVMDGLKRWSKKNPQTVMNSWAALQQHYNFTVEESQILSRTMALALAADNDPHAADWLSAIDPAWVNQSVREWRIRFALAQNDWSQAYYWILKLPQEERESSCWRYWNAQILTKIGETARAQEIFRSLSKEIDYYGVLASWQLQQTYKPTTKALADSAESEAHLANNAALQRARELYLLQLFSDARREWQWATSDMDQDQLLAAEKLASEWQWYDRAVVTATQTHDVNNISVRYPLAYSQDVFHFAKDAALNPAWVFAIMRRESNFMSDAKSNAGAMGLMQLMPNTAKQLAQKNINDSQLLTSTTNIHLGTRYLKQLANKFNDNLIKASAAYNIGPYRLQKWTFSRNNLPMDVWVEVLPWQETRDYVKAVVLGTEIYQQQLKEST